MVCFPLPFILYIFDSLNQPELERLRSGPGTGKSQDAGPRTVRRLLFQGPEMPDSGILGRFRRGKMPAVKHGEARIIGYESIGQPAFTPDDQTRGDTVDLDHICIGVEHGFSFRTLRVRQSFQ
jgi:hypothetical protein